MHKRVLHSADGVGAAIRSIVGSAVFSDIESLLQGEALLQVNLVNIGECSDIVQNIG